MSQQEDIESLFNEPESESTAVAEMNPEAEQIASVDMDTGKVADTPEPTVTSDEMSTPPANVSTPVVDQPPAPAPASPIVPQAVGTPMWVRIVMPLNCIVAVVAIALAIVGNNKATSNLERATELSADLAQQCSYNRATLAWLRGGSLDNDHPLWNENFQQVDLDREILLQIPTRCGVVNVQRPRPQSLNDRATLKLRVTNPSMVSLCRGKLLVRSSAKSHDPSSDYDYKQLGKWQRSLRKQLFDIPDLSPGASHDIEVSVKEFDNSDPEYTDFQVTFSYFKAS